MGAYWHLATRPDELSATTDADLRKAAPRFDQRLNCCTHPTLVHGHANLENFCFAPAAPGDAAVDVQYVGGGCGMKDVAYLLSCMDSDWCEARANDVLHGYFQHLRRAVAGTEVDPEALEAEWPALYPVSWADFNRFLPGWSSGDWRSHAYGRRLPARVLPSP